MSFMLKNNSFICILIFILSVTFYSYHLGMHGPEYRDDEIFYMQSTKQMMETGDWLSPRYFDQHRFQKPILFYWMMGLSYHVFGVNWFAARFPSVVMAGLTLVVTWLFAQRLFSRQAAFLSVAVLWTTPLFWRHAKNAVPDMALNFCVVFAIYMAYLFMQNPSKKKYETFFFLSCAFGFMIKGYAAVIAPAATVCVVSLWTKDKTFFTKIHWVRGLCIFTGIVAPWFIYMISRHGSMYLNYMLEVETASRLANDKAGSGMISFLKNFMDHFGFYTKTILQYTAPWSVFLLFVPPTVVFKKQRDPQLIWLGAWMMFMLFFFSLIYFTIAHYMLVITTPIAILISYSMLRCRQKGGWMSQLQQSLVLILTTLVTVILIMYAVFILGLPSFRGYVFIVIYGLLLGAFILKPNFQYSLSVLFILLLFAKLQAPSFAEQGLTPHTSYKRFAEVIHQNHTDDFVVGVGSHELHEKEFQVFLEQPVGKYANDHDGYTRHYLNKLMNHNETVYCLITRNDYNIYLRDFYEGLEIVHRESMFRKKIELDQTFWQAFRSFDQERMLPLIKHEVILIRKESDGLRS